MPSRDHSKVTRRLPIAGSWGCPGKHGGEAGKEGRRGGGREMRTVREGAAALDLGKPDGTESL